MNKVSRVKNENFTVISNVFLKDKNLSLKSKGFLSVIMGLPSDWEFSIKGVCSILKEGKSSIYNIIDELKQNGYCIVTSERDERGLFSGSDYTFFEEPQMDYPRTENRDTDNQPQLNNKELNKEAIKEEDILIEDWRNNFNAYLKLVEEARMQLLDDKVTRAKKQKYYPDIDYELSIEKMIDDFWGTERGWKHKVKSSKKTKEIDMAKTLANGFDLSANRVYKKAQKQSFSANTPKLNDGLVRPKDGVNADGTFNKNGFRYYHSVRDNIDYSIPLNAPPMPSFECEYDTLNKEWYYPKDNNDAYGELW